LRRTYQEAADRARGFAYYVKKKGYYRVGILCTNSPAFLEAIYGIGAAGAVNVGKSRSFYFQVSRTDRPEAINYRLKSDDIAYIFDHADVDAILVDAEFHHLLDGFRDDHPAIPLLIDTDTDISVGPSAGPYDNAVSEGLEYDKETGSRGWHGLETRAPDEEAVIALAYTSGTTARPKGVEYTHRGAYMGAIGNVIESGLNYHKGRCRYLWTLPMFHAMGMEISIELTIEC